MKEEKKKNHSCFEWIQLLISILIPVAIAVYTVLENNRDLAIATQNRAQDLDIADNEQKDLILHECQKTLSKLIEKYGADFNESSSASFVGRFATLSALNRLDLDRRNTLVRLLYDSKLITYRLDNYRPPINLQFAKLTDLDLISSSPRKALFYLFLDSAYMTRANFYHSNIYGARFNRADLSYANFSWTRNNPPFDEGEEVGDNHQQLFFTNVNLTSTSFSSSSYENVDFTEAIMENANLNDFFCINCSFSATTMNEVNMQNAVIHESSFMFSVINNANLYRASFGANVNFYETNLNYVNAAYATFTYCELNATKLTNTIFDHATFINSSFFQARMNKVSMQYSKVINGNFTRTDLSQSNWRYAYCERCIFDQANLTNVDLSDARFVESDFRNSTITEEQLRQLSSSKRSILLNGIIFN